MQGLNWLIHLYDNGINGILADEMVGRPFPLSGSASLVAGCFSTLCFQECSAAASFLRVIGVSLMLIRSHGRPGLPKHIPCSSQSCAPAPAGETCSASAGGAVQHSTRARNQAQQLHQGVRRCHYNLSTPALELPELG